MIGVLADRFGRRAVLVPCLVGFGTFGLLSALAPTFEVLLFLRLCQGIGAAGLVNLAVVLIFGLLLTALPVHLERELGLGAGAEASITSVADRTGSRSDLRPGVRRGAAGVPGSVGRWSSCR